MKRRAAEKKEKKRKKKEEEKKQKKKRKKRHSAAEQTKNGKSRWDAQEEKLQREAPRGTATNGRRPAPPHTFHESPFVRDIVSQPMSIFVYFSFPRFFPSLSSTSINHHKKKKTFCKSLSGTGLFKKLGQNSGKFATRVVCPSTQKTKRSQLTIVVMSQETRSFKCPRPPLFNWGCGARNPVFRGSSKMVKDKRTQHSDEFSQVNNHKHTQHKFSTSRPSVLEIQCFVV